MFLYLIKLSGLYHVVQMLFQSQYVTRNRVKERLTDTIEKKKIKTRPEKTLWKLAEMDRYVCMCVNVCARLSIKAQDDTQVKGRRYECWSMADVWHVANSPLVTATWIAKHNPVINPSSVSSSAPYILFDTHVHWRFPVVEHNNYWSYNTFHRTSPECRVVKVWRR